MSAAEIFQEKQQMKLNIVVAVNYETYYGQQRTLIAICEMVLVESYARGCRTISWRFVEISRTV